MDRLNPLAIPLLPVTKVWVCAIMALATTSSLNLMSQPKLLFVPSRVLSEPWRALTSLCYFGKLDFPLIQSIILIAKTNNLLEERYLHRMELLPHGWVRGLDQELQIRLREEIESKKTADFAHFFARGAIAIIASILILSRWCDTSISFLFLGPMLEKVMLYVICKNSPSEYFDFFGISIKAKYAPFLTLFIEIILSEEFHLVLPWFRKDVREAVNSFFKTSIVRQTILVFSVGHLWWFIQFFFLDTVHDEFTTSHQREWSTACSKFSSSRLTSDLLELLRLIITPPWYYTIVKKLMKEQGIRRGLERERQASISTEPLASDQDILLEAEDHIET